MKPLEGVRVIDLTSNVAGPLSTMVLAQLGADVIKVERPGTGDPARAWAPTVDGTSLTFRSYNRGKRSIVLDLGDPDGVAALASLLRDADVLIHSLRADAATRLGLDAQDLTDTYPDLIHCQVGAFGNGPIGSQLPGYDPVAQAFSGIMEMTGFEGMPPSRVPLSAIDTAAGLWAAIGVLSALLNRRVAEGGSKIEITLIDTAMSLLSPEAASAMLTGDRPRRYGSGHALGAPHQAFEAADRHMFIGAPSQALWLKLLRVLGDADVANDARFATPDLRLQNVDSLVAELNRCLSTRTAADWAQLLNDAGVPAVPVLGIDEAVRHDLAQERGWFENDGDVPLVRSPVLCDGVPLGAESGAPALGADTADVLMARERRAPGRAPNGDVGRGREPGGPAVTAASAATSASTWW